MWSEMYDLHSHSTHSDGLHSVEFVAKLMSDSGVKFWSLTDHDTIAGWKQANGVCNDLNMTFIPGVEITCEPALPSNDAALAELNLERSSKSWHLLAYFPEIMEDSSQLNVLAKWLEPLRESRIPRMKKMIQKLNDLGFEVNFEDVQRKASGSLGRPHLAEIMVDLGYVENKNEAFEKWIGDGMPAHVSQAKPTIEEAVKLVKSLSGFTSLAHPAYYGVPVDILAAYCQQIGVDSIEAFHRSHPDFYRFKIWEECKKQNLAVSCGSDFHGTDYGHLPGRMPVPVSGLHALIRQESFED